MAFVRQTVAVGHHGKPDRAYAMLLTVLVRMAAPAEFLRRMMNLNLDLPTPIKLTVFARLCRTLLADMERQARELVEREKEDFLGPVEAGQWLVSELQAADQILIDADPTTKHQLAALHRAAEEACGAVVRDAAAQVRRAIAVGAAAPLADLLRSESALMALKKCQAFARQVELAEPIRQTLSTLVTQLKVKVAGLLDAADNGRPREHGIVERELYWSSRMLELAGDLDEADRLRVRGARLVPSGRPRPADAV
jgi:hypothetical protein